MRRHLLESVAATIRDYRQGEIAAPDPDHVERWIVQFDESVQESMLAEMDHLLKNSYLSRERFQVFLRGLAQREELIEQSAVLKLAKSFMRLLASVTRPQIAVNALQCDWQKICLLEIQKHGSSQRDMVRLLKEILVLQFGLDCAGAHASIGTFLYLDDILFTGNRIIADLRHWIQDQAPAYAHVVIAVMACYNRGLWYTHHSLHRAADQAGKTIHLHWITGLEIEDRHWAAATCDGFHPTHIPDTPLTRAYFEKLDRLGFYPCLRTPGGETKVFSSETGRHLLEQQFLLAGLKIRSYCRNPQEILRPLGYHVLHGLGFGATLVTYRNCPNNCPLALWWGDPHASVSHPLSRWYPLLPRKV